MSDLGLATAGAGTRGTARPAAPANIPSAPLELVTTAAGLEALLPDWDDLFARAAAPQQVFQNPAFLVHWARHYLDGSMALHILAARREGRLAMLWPLVRRQRFGVSTLQFMGAPVAQFGDILLDPEADAENLIAAGWTTLERSGVDLFLAQKLRIDSSLSRWPSRRPPIVIESLQAPFASLASRVDAGGPGNVYSARDRSAYRRRLRRFAEQGELAFRSLPPGAEAVALARQAIAFKRDWLRRNAILSPTLSDPRFEAFFADSAADPAVSLHISTMERGGRPIGIDLSFDCKDTSFGHVIAGDPDCEHEGVGSVLIYHVFAAAKARGSMIFDMLAPADPYKQRHADGQTGVRDLAYAFTPLGRAYCEIVLRHARPLAKNLAKKLPATLVRSIASVTER